MKQCKDCKGWLPENDDNFYRHGDGYRFSPYCKTCHRKRTYASVQRQRDRRREAGVSLKANVATLEEAIQTRDSDKYLDRHLQRREIEREIQESLMRGTQGQQPNAGEMSFADIKYHSLNPPPVFRDLTNSMLRQQQRTFGWSVR